MLIVASSSCSPNFKNIQLASLKKVGNPKNAVLLCFLSLIYNYVNGRLTQEMHFLLIILQKISQTFQNNAEAILTKCSSIHPVLVSKLIP